MVKPITNAALLLIALLCAAVGYASNGKSSGEMNFLFCDIGYNDDALVEVRIKKSEKEADLRIGIYHLATKTLHLFVPDFKQDWSSPHFSADAKSVLFSIHYSKDSVVAAILNTETGKYIETTSGQKAKIRPAFMFDEKEIVYWVPVKNEFSGATLYVLYKQDIASGLETRLTEWRSYQPGHIITLPSRKIIVYGAAQRRRGIFEKNELLDAGYIVDSTSNVNDRSAEILTTYGRDPTVNSASNNEVVIFTVPTNNIVGVGGYYAYNVYAMDGSVVSQVTKYVPGKDRVMIRHAAISRDGKRIIFESYPSVPYSKSYGFWAKLFNADIAEPTPTDFGVFLINTDGSNQTRVDIPSRFRVVTHTVTRVQQ